MYQAMRKRLLLGNYMLFLIYLGLSARASLRLSTGRLLPLLMASGLLADAAFLSACNLRDNRTISLFCGLLTLESWYLLLSASDHPVMGRIFSALSPVLWYGSIRFVLLFLFQGGGYKFQTPVRRLLTGACMASLIGLLGSQKMFFLLCGIQFVVSWSCFVFVLLYHRERVRFVWQSERRCILPSLAALAVLVLAYCFSSSGVPGRLSNFGVYLPVLLLWTSVHQIIRHEHSGLPLSALFSPGQLALLVLSGAGLFGLVALLAGGGALLFLLLLDALAVFLYACNIALEHNLKRGQSRLLRESQYRLALQQLQREEAQNLEFANFLHDDILQDLLSVKNMLPKAAHPEVRQLILETLDHLSALIRERMQACHPALLSRLTLRENYQNLLDGVAQIFPHRRLCVSLDCADALFLVAPYDILVYRLLKELITNVYKHSTGDKAWVTLTQAQGLIRLCVSDNGTARADALRAADPQTHRGLAMIAERAAGMGGSVTFSDRSPHGVRIQVQLPMKGEVSYPYFVGR